MIELNTQVNGVPVRAQVADRINLADFLRDQLNLTGTHLGCEHGVCGACTVLMDGEPVRSCVVLAASVEGRSITTIEGMDNDPVAEVVRGCFSEAHALQCGFCTPGMVITVTDILKRGKCANQQEIREQLAGSICRCTGYMGIVNATGLARDRIAQAE